VRNIVFFSVRATPSTESKTLRNTIYSTISIQTTKLKPEKPMLKVPLPLVGRDTGWG
jgi:hypothetical protein